MQGRREDLWAPGQDERSLARHTNFCKLNYQSRAPIAMGPQVSDSSDPSDPFSSELAIRQAMASISSKETC